MLWMVCEVWSYALQGCNCPNGLLVIMLIGFMIWRLVTADHAQTNVRRSNLKPPNGSEPRSQNVVYGVMTRDEQ